MPSFVYGVADQEGRYFGVLFNNRDHAEWWAGACLKLENKTEQISPNTINTTSRVFPANLRVIKLVQVS